MPTKEFNNFYKYLKENRELAELCDWAFMQMTDKQICKIIDYYYIIGELKITDNGFLRFGRFGYQLRDYEITTGNTYYREYYTEADYYIVKVKIYNN